ncbi:MAG: DUF3168 domain-containing protein [Magnetococcales bacterium]|nr:DUF3168 domain-containing protein [Magnetococcales bacterium]
MTTLQEQIVTILATANVAGGRIYPHVAPNGATLPNISYFVVSSVPTATFADGYPITETRIQFDSYDSTYSGAQATAKALSDALAASSLTNNKVMARDSFDLQTMEYRVITDFSFFS